ncbi:Cyclic pyranopterin phosphate synthase (MoaA) [hydrothermal vent metagenome]|uniref:GTP 3',8-cyclase n=1 Tax=hydrothermal vent metagenome TaxID=652676 RepID=A0A3B1E376_9ZZZZ
MSQQLIDSFGRIHNNLRISVTDRCNLRCVYCMPAEDVLFMKKELLLTFEEIERLIRAAVPMGINKIRLTGGEPLVRKDLHKLIANINTIEEIDDLGLTTNGLLLVEQAEDLFNAGLRRINISLDALDPQINKELTRRDSFDQAMAGIQAAQNIGFSPIKINAVAMRGKTEDQIVSFGKLARETGLEIRFIEFMPLDADNSWEREKVLFAHEIIDMLSKEIMPLKPVGDHDPRVPAVDYQFEDGRGKIGLIASVSRPFCMSCNRFRVTADGKLRNCLFSLEETDVKSIMRGGGSDEEIQQAMSSCIAAKKEGHEINTSRFIQPDRPMYSIGG